MNLVKRISAEACTGCVLCDYDGPNSLGFLADLPENAIVDRIKVEGVYLDNLNGPTIIKYPIDCMDGDHRVAAIVHLPEGTNVELVEKVNNFLVTEFDVYYHVEATVEVN